MEKNKTFKIVAIVGLVVAVIGLAIGFAAFSATLNISTFNATAKAGESEAVFGNLVTFQDDAKCTVSTGEGTVNAGTATGHTWSGITATLNPGTNISCTATIKNTSAYTAYLTKLSTNGSKITCSGSAQNLEAVCSAIQGSIFVGVGGNVAAFSSSSAGNLTSPTTTIAPTNGTVVASLGFWYNESGAVPDADVTISIPAIEVGFATAR